MNTRSKLPTSSEARSILLYNAVFHYTPKVVAKSCVDHITDGGSHVRSSHKTNRNVSEPGEKSGEHGYVVILRLVENTKRTL